MNQLTDQHKQPTFVVIGKCKCGEPAVLRMRVLLSPTKAMRDIPEGQRTTAPRSAPAPTEAAARRAYVSHSVMLDGKGYWNDGRRNVAATIAEKLKPYFTNDMGKAEELNIQPATVQIIAQEVFLVLSELAGEAALTVEDAYNSGVDDAKAAIRAESCGNGEEHDFCRPVFINAIARKCDPRRVKERTKQ